MTEKVYTQAEVDAMVAKFKAENAGKPRRLSCKVSAKGAISVYGLNSVFPVTLYLGQWQRLAEFVPEILAYGATKPAGLAEPRS